jgi:hypothetical protein
MVRQQGGTAQWNGGAAAMGSITVNYPVAFSNYPLIFATCLRDNLAGDVNAGIGVLAIDPTTSFKINWRDNQGNVHTSLDFMWFAVGDE